MVNLIDPLNIEAYSFDSGYESEDVTGSSSWANLGRSSEDEQLDAIRFIHAKQKIMARVSAKLAEEEIYDAVSARDFEGAPETPPSKTSGTIWNEARDVLHALSAKTGEPEAIAVSGGFHPPARGPKQSSRKRPKIETSGVNRVASTEYVVGDHLADKPSARLDSSQVDMKKWMTKALVHDNSQESICAHRQDYSWKMITDPLDYQSVGLVPPSQTSLSHSIQIGDAISVSGEARILLTSSPPYTVVHANKAFLQSTGSSSNDLIGQSMDAILQVSGIHHYEDSGRLILEVKLTPAGSTLFHILLVPVVESKSNSLSHVMIRLLERTESTPPTERQFDANAGTSNETTAGESLCQLLGAVG